MPEHERYTHGHHESVLRTHRWRTAENSAAYLLPHLFAGASLLDLGCGPGTITIDLARRVAPGPVTGIDVSEEVIAHAESLAEDNGLAAVAFRVGNAYSIDADDDSFDIVHAHQLLQHVADPVAVLREARRVLKPGGILAVREVDYGGTIWAPASGGLTDWLHAYEAVCRANGGDPHAGRSVKRWARSAGFSSLECSATAWCFASDGEREWWGQAWASRAVDSDFASHAIETAVATLSDLHAISAAWSDWVTAPDGWFMLPHSEVLARA